VTTYELRARSLDDADGYPRLWFQPEPGEGLARCLQLADSAASWVDVLADGRYLVTSGWYWWPRDGKGDDGMHQIGSHGWCHDCHGDGLGYVHHLDYDVELAVLAHEARTDRVLRRQCEADGLTPEAYAAGVAGRAVPLHGDHSFVIDVHELGVSAAGLAEFAVDMWDMTTWKVAVGLAPGAPLAAEKLAERLAWEAGPKRCYDCKGHRGHARDCSVVRTAELVAKYGPLDSSQAEG
jgi:hypothetical protein